MFRGPTTKSKNITYKEKLGGASSRNKIDKTFSWITKKHFTTQFWFFLILYYVKRIVVYCRAKDTYDLFFKSYHVSKSITLTFSL